MEVDFCPDCGDCIPAGLTECETCDTRSKPLVQLKEVNADQLTPRSFRVCLMVRDDDENGRLQTLKIAWNRVAKAFPKLFPLVSTGILPSVEARGNQ